MMLVNLSMRTLLTIHSLPLWKNEVCGITPCNVFNIFVLHLAPIFDEPQPNVAYKLSAKFLDGLKVKDSPRFNLVGSSSSLGYPLHSNIDLKRFGLWWFKVENKDQKMDPKTLSLATNFQMCSQEITTTHV